MADSLTAPKVLSLPKVGTGTRNAFLKITRVMVGAPAGTEVEVDATATYQFLSVPAGAFVAAVRTRVITAFTASVTITLGDGDGAAGYLDSTEIAPQVAETAGVYKNSVIQANTYSGGKKYLAADTLDAVIAAAVPAAGLLEILVEHADATFGAA